MSSISGNNLDLSGISEPDQLASEIETFYRNDSALKTELSKNWERNHWFLDGKQWLVYEKSAGGGGGWAPLQLNSANEYLPRPVTNYTLNNYQTLKGYLLKSKYDINVIPNTQRYKDKRAAKLAEHVSAALDEKLRDVENSESAVSILLGYGTVFMKSFWDTSFAGGQVKIPKVEQSPKTDPMTGQIIGTEEVPVIDPATGEPVYTTMPLGDVNTEVVDPLRISIDPIASEFHKIRWIMESSIQPLSWIRETYNKSEDGYTGRAEEVEEEKNLSYSMRKFYSLRNSSGVRSSGLGFNSATSSSSDEMVPNCAIVKEYYERPTATYPKGRLMVVANGIPLYVGENPYEGPDTDDWHPYSECRWELLPGRFFGKSPLDDTCELNKIINSIDSMIILTRQTMASPQKLIPLGIGIEPGSWTGEPGLEKFYRPDGTGSKPETIPSAGINESVFVERRMRTDDIQKISGAIDILKGDKPPGVTAASALNMLYEVGTGNIHPALERFKRFKENYKKKQLKLLARKYKEPRPEFARLLQMKAPEFTEEEINRFIGADLQDNCNLRIEPGSTVPKIKSAEIAMLLELASTGTLGLEAPANRTEFLSRIGIEGFNTDFDPDQKRASWENDLLDSIQYSPDNRPIVLDVDNHDIHIHCHSNRMKEPSFMELPLEVQQAYMQHIQEHEDFKAQKEQIEMIKAAQMGQAVMPQSNGMEDRKIQRAGTGPTKEIKNALFSDSMVPGALASE